MKSFETDLIEKLSTKVINHCDKATNDIDRLCWQVVHEYHHGVMPSEYDIREIDEELYLTLLERVKELNLN